MSESWFRYTHQLGMHNYSCIHIYEMKIINVLPPAVVSDVISRFCNIIIALYICVRVSICHYWYTHVVEPFAPLYTGENKLHWFVSN